MGLQRNVLEPGRRAHILNLVNTLALFPLGCIAVLTGDLFDFNLPDLCRRIANLHLLLVANGKSVAILRGDDSKLLLIKSLFRSYSCGVFFAFSLRLRPRR